MALATLTLLLSACGDGGSEVSRPVFTFGVSGAVSGLSGSVLLAFGMQQASLSRNGLFELGAVPKGTVCDIVVLLQPQRQTCIVRNGCGCVLAAVSDIAVLYANTIYAIGDRVERATGPATLRLQEGTMLEVRNPGAFNFLGEHEVAWQ